MSVLPNIKEIDALNLRSGGISQDEGGAGTDRYTVETVPIASLVCTRWLRVDGEDRAHVRSLAEVEEPLPPIVVHRRSMRVIDGNHRLRAALARGSECIPVVFFNGSEDDGFILAVRLNSAHGLPLSRADRSAAAARIIRTNPQWSDRAIASTTGLSDKTVAAIRRRACAEIPQMNDRVGRDGRARPIDSSTGRIAASKLIAENPDVTLREIASASGISLGTARDVRERMRRGQNPVPASARASAERAEQAERADTSARSVLRMSAGDSEDVRAKLVSERRQALLLENLRRDPSLRYSEVGRAMLRLLALHTIPTDDWNRLIESVPVHCSGTVAQLAHSCAAAWEQFAQELDEPRQRRRASGF